MSTGFGPEWEVVGSADAAVLPPPDDGGFGPEWEVVEPVPPPLAVGPTLAAPSTVEPAPQQPVAPPETPKGRKLEFEGTTYEFTPEHSVDDIQHFVDKQIAAKKPLTPKQAGGRSQDIDSQPNMDLRGTTEVSPEGMKEYAEFLSGEDADGNPVTIKPEDVTPQLLDVVIDMRQEKAAEWAEIPNVNQVALHRFNADTEAMERDQERLWSNETTREHNQRAAVARDADPERDAAIISSRPENIARKNQPRETFWAENLLREYQQKYGNEVPQYKKLLFKEANTAYEAWLKKNPKGADAGFDEWRRGDPLRVHGHPGELEFNEKYKHDPGSIPVYENMSEAMVARHGFRKGGSDWVPYTLKRIPFAGAAVTATDLLYLRNAVKHVDAGKATDSDWFTIASAIDAAEKSKDSAFLKQAWDLVSHLPAFGVEFMMTGGAFTAARAGVRKGAMGLLGKQAMRSAVPRLATKAAGFTAGAAAQTAANVPLVASKVAEKWMPEYGLTPDEANQITVAITGDDPSFLKALAKGYGAAFIEMGSERAGAAVGLLAKSKVGKALAKLPLARRATGLKAALVDRFLSKGGTATQANDILRRAGWNGMIGEVFEEKVADVAGGVTGIEEDFGATGKLLTNDPEGWEQLGVEALAFAVIPFGQTALGAAEEAMTPQEERDIRRLEALPKKLKDGGTVSRQDAAAWKREMGEELPFGQAERTRVVKDAFAASEELAAAQQRRAGAQKAVEEVEAPAEPEGEVTETPEVQEEAAPVITPPPPPKVVEKTPETPQNETSRLAAKADIPPNAPDSSVAAKKRPDGEWRLLWTGTRNEVFPDETFASAKEARDTFKAVRATVKASQEPTAPPAAPETPVEEAAKALGADPANVMPVYRGTDEKGAAGLRATEGGAMGDGVYFYTSQKPAESHVTGKGRLIVGYVDKTDPAVKIGQEHEHVIGPNLTTPAGYSAVVVSDASRVHVPEGQFQAPAAPETPVEEAEERFPTAVESAKAGKSWAGWQQPISDAFVAERIDETNPDYQSTSEPGFTLDEYNAARDVYGKHVRVSLPHKKEPLFGKVTDISDDFRSVTVTEEDGSTSLQVPERTDVMEDYIRHRQKQGKNITAEQEYMARQASETPVEAPKPKIGRKPAKPAETQQEAAQEPEPAPLPDVKLAAGEIATTRSGRQTTPFPRVDVSTERKAANTVKRADKWLWENAVEEARSRGDEFVLQQFEGEDPKRLPPATKDSMSDYLFGEPSQPSPLKPKSKGKKAAQPAPEPTAQAETAAEEAQRKAEEARPKTQRRGVGPGGGEGTSERVRDNDIPGELQVPNKEVNRRRKKAKGMRKASLRQRIRDVVQILRGVTRAQEYIPNIEKYGAANEFFRLLRNVPGMSQDEAIRITAAIVDPLTPNQLEAFEWYTVMNNLAASLKVGQPLRFGFESAEAVDAELERMQGLVDRIPAVQEAIETRQKIVKETTAKLVEYDLLPEAALENTDTYYHQQVHFYMIAHGMKGGGTRAGKVTRTFQRGRVEGKELSDEEMDYNTSYIEAEVAWLTDAHMEIEKEGLLRDLMDNYDIRSRLVKEAADRDVSWQDIIPDGYDLFQPEPGNHFYRAFTLPERIVAKLQENVIETAELTKDDLQQVLAMGNPNRQFVLPAPIAAQLAGTRQGEAAHGLALLADEAMKSWKVYTLLNPKRAFAYNLRNLTGDLDPVIASDPTLLRHLDRAMKELSRYHKGRLQLSPELRLARDLSVIGSGFVAEEVPDLKDLAVFRRFVKESGKTSLPMRPIKGYMDIVKPLTQWREDALRYAAFLGYQDQLRKGRVKHYGGSKKAVVQAIKRDMGVDAAAAHLARNLLGDYGNISVAGNWIRKRLMPFWSFQEINLKRVPRLLANAYEAGGTMRTAGVLSAAAGRAILMSRVAWMFAGLWAWNNLIMGGDEEEELAGYDRATPHVILGRNPDGSIRVFRRVGALGDFLEWFGINEAIAMLGKHQAGQVDTRDVLEEMAYATPEKVLNSLRPDLKALYELPAGQSMFPEPFQPRSVRRGEAVSHIFGLADEYRWMKGWALEDGTTARPHYWQRWAVGVVDPRHSALSQAYELRSDFLKKKGKEQKGVFPVSRYKEARDAAKFENYGAFVNWKRTFVAERGDKAKDDFKGWLGMVDPIGSRLNDSDELEFVTEFLTNEQRDRLAVARNYSHELRDLMVAWWDADEQSTEMKKAVTFSAFGRMDISKPDPKDYTSDAKFQKALVTFKMDNERAAQDIQSMASSHTEAQQLLVEYYRRPSSTGKKQTEFLADNPNKWKPSYEARALALAALYGEAKPRDAVRAFRDSVDVKTWDAKRK